MSSGCPGDPLGQWCAIRIDRSWRLVAAGGVVDQLGIACERIDLGKPQQNGRHERMHRTLKDETANPPAATLAEQQRCFDRFVHEFNVDRPHEALGFKTPASLHRPSARSYPCALREPVYADDLAVRRVRSNGEIKWVAN